MTTNNDEKKKKKKLFYTTSDMMKTINKSIASLDSPNDAISPRVELQRRMPDGSTRRADDKDLEAADMDSKLKQAADQVADLNPQQKIEWAERLRQEGNKLYQEKDYREALDVYLTCLVAKSDHADFIGSIFLPVMNNLAQCCIQMCMYRKAQEFCNMALEEVKETNLESLVQLLVAKLYFRRGRAKRLSGEYAAATIDLEAALSMLDSDTLEYRSVKKELQLVKRAEMEERQNEKRQERAMQRLLGGETKQVGSTSNSSVDCPKTQPSGLYQEQNNKRAYSTLTATRPRDNGDEQDDANEQGCWQWYLSMVARVAGKLLVLLGDEEYKNRLNEHGGTLNDRKTD